LEHANEFLSDIGLIIGDINTGKHHLDEQGASFYGAEYLDKLEEVGFIDSWRIRNSEKREFSWYSNKGNGFRLDHVFSTPGCDSRISNIYYSHHEREEKVSDHSAMIVDLPFEGSTVHEVEGILSNRVLIKQEVSSQL
jgi:exonuclease III